ncbi:MULTISPECIES: AI-2E family transporter [unclassified Acinetobacter]|uniref:AI-2E family transporter n=1 Tax=unclassified Acinetobacter TaxID=196816 RepID=UPI0035B91A53
MKKHAPTLQRFLLFGLLIGLIVLSFEILKYFIVPVVWAAIIAYMTWPVYRRIHFWCGQRKNLSALIMTVMLSLIVGIPLIFGIFLLKNEGRQLFLEIQHQFYSGGIKLPDSIRSLPIVGQELQRLFKDLNANPTALTDSITVWVQSHSGYSKVVLGEISRNFTKMFFAFLSLFFLYRDGNVLLEQIRRAFYMVIGERINHYFQTISDTTRAVVYGVGLTAVAQSLLAGASYAVAGVPNPMLLTLLTFVLALIPFGTPVAYTGVALWLLSKGLTMHAIGIMVWGVAIVSSADNVIRPLVISGATKIPFLFIMFGVLGGIASFGLIGLFIGPVILTVLLAIWREWVHENLPQATPEHVHKLHDIQDQLKHAESSPPPEKS